MWQKFFIMNHGSPFVTLIVRRRWTKRDTSDLPMPRKSVEQELMFQLRFGLEVVQHLEVESFPFVSAARITVEPTDRSVPEFIGYLEARGFVPLPELPELPKPAAIE